MKRYIPKETNYLVPEGKYLAELHDVFELPSKYDGEKKIRFQWRIIDLTDEDYDYMVGKTYQDGDVMAKKLRDDLKSWLGNAYRALITFNGKCDLKRLIGRRAELIVSHIHNPDHSTPYVCIRGIFPDTTIELEEAA